MGRDSVKSTLTQHQRVKTLMKTQEARETQRRAVLFWAGRWEEYVQAHPEVIGASRDIMKEGFDSMQAHEPEKHAKAHFSLVMNFLRQSGRRKIGTWKDYEPKNWKS